MASCFSLRLAAVRCLASSAQSHACPLVGRVSSQQPHNFFFLRPYSCVWLWHSGAFPWPDQITSTTLCCLAFLWLLPVFYEFKKCLACLWRGLMRLSLCGCRPPVSSFSRGRSVFRIVTPGLSSTVSCCLLLGSGKLYWLALFHTDSCRDLDIGAFLLRIYRGWHRVDGASLGSAKLQNLIENISEGSVGCSHVCKQPHLSSIYKLHKEQRLREALGINSGWNNHPASISNFSSFDCITHQISCPISPRFYNYKWIVQNFGSLCASGFTE